MQYKDLHADQVNERYPLSAKSRIILMIKEITIKKVDLWIKRKRK
jgi:hypothetical protein